MQRGAKTVLILVLWLYSVNFVLQPKPWVCTWHSWVSWVNLVAAEITNWTQLSSKFSITNGLTKGCKVSKSCDFKPVLARSKTKLDENLKNLKTLKKVQEEVNKKYKW